MHNLPPMNIRYPFDPTGRNTDNLVRDELRKLPLIHKRIIVPTMGAFYAESLRVRNLERELEKGKDYELCMLYHDATVETGKDVNIGIYFSNLDIIGEVYLTYQVIGGRFTGVWEAVQQYVNVLLVDPRQVRWDDVLDKPDFYVPKEHFHDINDVYGLNALIPFIEEIRDAILRVNKKGLVQFNHRLYNFRADLEATIDELRNKITSDKEGLKVITNSVELVKTNLAALNSELGKLDNKHTGKYNELKGLIDTISPKVDNLVERVSTIESGLSNLEDKINKNKEKLTQHEQVHNTLNQNITNLDNKYNNITSGLTSKIDNLIPRVEEEETKSTQFKNKLDNHEGRITDLENKRTENLDSTEGKEDFKIIEKELDKAFFEHNDNDPKKYKQLDGFISGTAHSDDIKKLRYIKPRKVGEVDFKGFNVVHNNGNVTAFLSFGEYDHYISSFNKNNNKLTNEKIVTDWGLMNDPKLQNILLDTVINENRIKYVDSTNGNDDTGDGTWRAPYRTFLKAFDELTPSNKAGIIRLAEGQTHTVTNKKTSDWLMCRMRLPLLVIESYGPRTNQRIGYLGTSNNPYTNNIWNGFTSHQDNGVDTVLLFVNGSNQNRSNYVFDGYFNKYMIYFMGIHVKLDQNTDRDMYSKGLSLIGVVGDAYIYSYLSRFSLLKEHTYLLTKSYTGRENGIYFEEFRNSQGQEELSVNGLGKIFKPHITSSISGDNQYNYNGLNIHTDHPSLYTDEILDRYIPKLKHGKLTWNSNINTNISRGNKLDPSLLPISKQANNAINLLDDGIFVNNNLSGAGNTTGFSCDSLNDLPEKPWVRGTSVLAKGPDGNCFRLVPPESLFQDIGVRITTDKVNIRRTNDTTDQLFNLKCIVTNSGVKKNNKTQFTLTLPSQNTVPYTVSDITHVLSKCDRVTKLNDHIYEIYGLQPGGTVVFSFTLTPTGFGSYQIGAQINGFTEFDTDVSNNTDTINLTSSEIIKPSNIDDNYIPSTECPRIVGTVLETNKTLYPVPTKIININDINISVLDIYNKDIYNNVYNYIKPSSDGSVKIKFINTSSIILTRLSDSTGDVVLVKPLERYPLYVNDPNNSNINYPFNQILTTTSYFNGITMKYADNLISMSVDKSAKINTNRAEFPTFTYDINTGILTIPNAKGIYNIICRPKGNNCNYQIFSISCPLDRKMGDVIEKRYKIEGLDSRYYSIETIRNIGENSRILTDNEYLNKLYPNTPNNDKLNMFEAMGKTNIIHGLNIRIPSNVVNSFKIYYEYTDFREELNIPVIKGNFNISQTILKTNSEEYRRNKGLLKVNNKNLNSSEIARIDISTSNSISDTDIQPIINILNSININISVV